MKRHFYTALAALLAALALGCYQNQSTTSTSTSTSASGSAGSAPAATSAPAPAATSAPAPSQPDAKEAPGKTAQGQEVALPGGLKYVDLKVGDGDIAEAGMKATVHYTGWLTDGTKFDSSLDRGQPFPFTIGAGQVIRGWDEGVKGMRIGGKRHLTIPPEMGYGAGGYPPTIPPNATLVFDVELLGLSR